MNKRQQIKSITYNHNNCIELPGYKDPKGYDRVFIKGGKTHGAHRYSYEYHIGPIPTGMFVCHKCDNPPCINPNHLFLGTNQDNVNDKVIKNRQGKGEQISSSKLTEDQVREIRAKHIFRVYTYQMLADEYNVSSDTIQKIVKRKLWRHL